MLRFETARPGFTVSAGAVLVALLSATANSAPAVQQVAGTFIHKGSVTIIGSGFGTKAVAAPVIWDDASGVNILSKWTGVQPSGGSYQMLYRAVQRNVPLPHNHITKYMAGAHGGSGDLSVGLWKAFTFTSYPVDLYFSYYQAVDPDWTFGGDNNFKTMIIATGGTSMYGSPFWFTEYNNSRFVDPTTTADLKWHLFDNSGVTLDFSSQSAYGGIALNPIAGGWIKMEHAIRLTPDGTGFIKQWENGALKINYAGPTDKLGGYASLPTVRAVGIGGYARNYSDPGNWRYFADVYLDMTLQRVVLANNAVLTNATVIEPQIPVAWANGTIGLSVNLGKFKSGEVGYLFVVDGSGAANSVGYRVIIGGSEVKPNPPAGIQVQ